MASEFCTLEAQHVLIDGFCKREYVYNIPLMLIKLILKFYNEIIYWKIKGDRLKHIRSMTKGERVFSAPITIKRIPFQFFLYPNGKYSTKHNAKFGICIKHMNDAIDYVVINGKWYNKEFDIFSVFTVKYTKESDLGSSLFNLATSQNIKALNFYGKIDILCIKPKTMNPSLLYIKPDIKLQNKSHFEWKIDEKVVKKIKAECIDDSTRRLYHSTFYGISDNFVFKLVRRINSKYKYHLCVFFMQFPMKIHAMDIIYSLQTYSNDIAVGTKKDRTKAKVTHDNLHKVMDVCFRMDKNQLINTAYIVTLCCVFDIEIIDIYTADGSIVPKSEWVKYGVIDCKNDKLNVKMCSSP